MKKHLIFGLLTLCACQSKQENEEMMVVDTTAKYGVSFVMILDY